MINAFLRINAYLIFSLKNYMKKSRNHLIIYFIDVMIESIKVELYNSNLIKISIAKIYNQFSYWICNFLF